MYLTKVSKKRICHLFEGRLLKYLILLTGNPHKMNANLIYFPKISIRSRQYFTGSITDFAESNVLS